MSRFWCGNQGVAVAQLPVGRGQLSLALLHVVGHLVEGLHQEADFIAAFLIDVDIIIPPGHLHGAFGQLANGGGNLPGHV